MRNIVLINNLRTTWPTKILVAYFSFPDNLLQEDYIIFQNMVHNFEIVQFPLKER